MTAVLRMIQVMAIILNFESIASSPFIPTSINQLPTAIPLKTDKIDLNATDWPFSGDSTSPENNFLVSSDNRFFPFKLADETGLLYKFTFNELYKKSVWRRGKDIFLIVNTTNKEAVIVVTYDKRNVAYFRVGEEPAYKRMLRDFLNHTDACVYVKIQAVRGDVDGDISFVTHVYHDKEQMRIMIAVAVAILIVIVIARRCSTKVLRVVHTYDMMPEYEVSSISVNPR